MIAMNQTNSIRLGLLGLVPFLACVFFIYSNILSDISQTLFIFYSASILAFLAGTLWFETTDKHQLLSNAITLMAFSALAISLFSVLLSLLILALGYIMTLVIDMNRRLPQWYKALRSSLSLTVLLCHLSVVAFIMFQNMTFL